MIPKIKLPVVVFEEQDCSIIISTKGGKDIMPAPRTNHVQTQFLVSESPASAGSPRQIFIMHSNTSPIYIWNGQQGDGLLYDLWTTLPPMGEGYLSSFGMVATSNYVYVHGLDQENGGKWTVWRRPTSASPATGWTVVSTEDDGLVGFGVVGANWSATKLMVDYNDVMWITMEIGDVGYKHWGTFQYGTRGIPGQWGYVNLTLFSMDIVDVGGYSFYWAGPKRTRPVFVVTTGTEKRVYLYETNREWIPFPTELSNTYYPTILSPTPGIYWCFGEDSEGTMQAWVAVVNGDYITWSSPIPWGMEGIRWSHGCMLADGQGLLVTADSLWDGGDPAHEFYGILFNGSEFTRSLLSVSEPYPAFHFVWQQMDSVSYPANWRGIPSLGSVEQLPDGSVLLISPQLPA